MEKQEIGINAVIDRDLLHIIDEFGLLDDFNKGKLSCPVCEKTLNFDNVGGFKVTDNSILIICDDSTCLSEVTKK